MQADFEKAWAEYFEPRKTRLNPAQIQAYERFALSNRDRGQQFIRRLESHSDLKLDLKGKRILDIGSAYGGFVIGCALQGADAYGIEIVDHLHALALANASQEKGRITLLHGDILDRSVLPNREDGLFDLLIANDVFEHIYNSTALFQRIQELSKEETIVYFAIPNGEAWQSIETEGHKFIFGLTLLEPGDWASVVGPFNIYYRPLKFYQLHFCQIGFPYLYIITQDSQLVRTAPDRVQSKFAELAQRVDQNPFSSPSLNSKAKHQLALLQQRLAADLTEKDPFEIHLLYDTHFWRGYAVQKIHPALEKAENVYRISLDPTTSVERRGGGRRPQMTRTKSHTSSIRVSAKRAMQKPLTILFNGHDFKFLAPVIAHYRADVRYQVLLDEHTGHQITEIDKSERLLTQADVIFCEWCLGNAEWYSHHKRADQILIIRLHHQEVGLHYLDNIDWSCVDRIIFICQNNMALFLDKFPLMKDRSVLIYNPIDCAVLDQEKLAGAEFNLGFIGTAPKRKAPHLAFEIFSKLKKIDTRYTLFFKGKQAWEYDWLWRRPDERQYYEEFYATVNQSAYVNAIGFDPFGNDMPVWFSKIGFLLSTSDHEGSHQAVAEAMATGTIPVIRNWDGADELYPERFVFKSVDEAVELILESRTPERYCVEKAAVKTYAQHNFDQQVIIAQCEHLLESLIDHR